MIRDLYQFISDNWYYILLLIYLITMIINIISATRYKTSLNLVQFKEIFDLVVEAEEKFPGKNRGAEKLAFVISKSSIKSNDVIKLVEMVLNSPEKK